MTTPVMVPLDDPLQVAFHEYQYAERAAHEAWRRLVELLTSKTETVTELCETAMRNVAAWN